MHFNTQGRTNATGPITSQDLLDSIHNYAAHLCGTHDKCDKSLCTEERQKTIRDAVRDALARNFVCGTTDKGQDNRKRRYLTGE